MIVTTCVLFLGFVAFSLAQAPSKRREWECECNHELKLYPWDTEDQIAFNNDIFARIITSLNVSSDFDYGFYLLILIFI